jgi:hypothetical protein
MRVLFSGELWISYRQFYVESRKQDFGADLKEAFAGQRNGLCGAARPGFLHLTTGLHTGRIGLAVEAHEERPAVDEAWEEIVEASFTPGSTRIGLLGCGGQECWPLLLDRVSHRVRYCGSGMELGRAAGTREEDAPQLDRYLLQFWPAPAGEDRVVKQTSAAAAYWHGFAGELAPPRPGESAQAAESADQALLAREALRWGGRLPSERLRRVQGNVAGLIMLDCDLSEAIAEAEPGTQRSMARWAARRACARAGIAGLAWIAPALTALDEGRALPSPLDDTERTWRLLWADERVPHTTVTYHNGRLRNVSQQAAALPALWGAAEPDPLRAALEALHAAVVTFGVDYPVLLEEVRRTFPAATRRR